MVKLRIQNSEIPLLGWKSGLLGSAETHFAFRGSSEFWKVGESGCPEMYPNMDAFQMPMNPKPIWIHCFFEQLGSPKGYHFRYHFSTQVSTSLRKSLRNQLINWIQTLDPSRNWTGKSLPELSLWIGISNHISSHFLENCEVLTKSKCMSVDGIFLFPGGCRTQGER